MKKIETILREEMKQLETIVEEAEKRLKNAPKGHLRITKNVTAWSIIIKMSAVRIIMVDI